MVNSKLVQTRTKVNTKVKNSTAYVTYLSFLCSEVVQQVLGTEKPSFVLRGMDHLTEVLPDSVGEDEGRSGCQAPGSPGGLQARQILYRPDRHVTYYSRARSPWSGIPRCT